MKPLAISVGDPAGIGPEVALQAIARAPDERFLVFGDARRLEARAAELGIARDRVTFEGDAVPDETIAAHAPTARGGAAQLAALDAAIASVRAGRARALVTGPVGKAAVHMAGPDFIGQTEHLARADGRAEDAVTMLFLGPRLRVALVTTHLAIRDASAAITPARVERACVHLDEALARLGVAGAIHVCGLNPHAGERGRFGDEEPRAIAPGLDLARARTERELVGPRPAEAVFRDAAAGTLAGVVAMIHDQATIASKLLDWGAAVNVTWGLSFVRTSVDHGVAYDAAARDDASPEGMIAAVELARRLVPA